MSKFIRFGDFLREEAGTTSADIASTDNALDFIDQVKKKTILFYEGLPKETIYKGIVSECETFIQNINKYIYLFKLCDVY